MKSDSIASSILVSRRGRIWYEMARRAWRVAEEAKKETGMSNFKGSAEKDPIRAKGFVRLIDSAPGSFFLGGPTYPGRNRHTA